MCKRATLGSQGLIYWKLAQQTLEMGISLHSGLVFENHGGSIHQELREIVEVGSENGASLSLSLSLYGCSVKETWKGNFITGDPERYVKKALAKGISFHEGSAGKPARGLIYQRL
jgi:hypothetical protein